MKAKVLQISYEPERDRLTWDGWDLHCGQSMEVLLPDQLGGGTWRSVSFEYNDDGWVHARIFWCVSDWLVGDGDERVKKRRGVDLVVFTSKIMSYNIRIFKGAFEDTAENGGVSFTEGFCPSKSLRRKSQRNRLLAAFFSVGGGNPSELGQLLCGELGTILIRRDRP